MFKDIVVIAIYFVQEIDYYFHFSSFCFRSCLFYFDIQCVLHEQLEAV